MSKFQLVFAPVSLDKLKREQPKLHRELCEGIAKIYAAKHAIDRLSQHYVIDGALSELLQLVDDAMIEIRASHP